MQSLFLTGACAAALSGCAPVAASADEADAQAIAPTLFGGSNKRGHTLVKVDLVTAQEVLRLAELQSIRMELATLARWPPRGAGLLWRQPRWTFSAPVICEKVASYDWVRNARPHGIVLAREWRIYVTAEAGRKSSRLPPCPPTPYLRRSAMPPARKGSHNLAVSPDARTAWTTDLGSRTVTRVDLVTRRAPLSVTVGDGA